MAIEDGDLDDFKAEFKELLHRYELELIECEVFSGYKYININFK